MCLFFIPDLMTKRVDPKTPFYAEWCLRVDDQRFKNKYINHEVAGVTYLET
jgi:hypothetical protein